MKKISIVLLSLICCLSLAACSSSGDSDKPKTESNVILVDKEITVYVGETYTFRPTGAESFNYSSSKASLSVHITEKIVDQNF